MQVLTAQDPGIIILDSSDSNQNGISTSNLSFRWVMESAPNQKPETSPPSPPEIDNTNAQKTYFTARKAGTYTVSLQILTFQGAESKKDTVNYFVRNIAPVANAGSDSIGQISTDIVLDGRSPLIVTVILLPIDGSSFKVPYYLVLRRIWYRG